MYKLFVETTSRRARIVPGKSVPGIAERVFGELSTEDALANREGLEDAVRGILADKGIRDGDLYTITLPDALLPNKAGETDTDNKGPISEVEKAHDDVLSPEELALKQENAPPVTKTEAKQEPAKIDKDVENK